IRVCDVMQHQSRDLPVHSVPLMSQSVPVPDLLSDFLGSTSPQGVGQNRPGSALPSGSGQYRPGSALPSGSGQYRPGRASPQGVGLYRPKDGRTTLSGSSGYRPQDGWVNPMGNPGNRPQEPTCSSTPFRFGNRYDLLCENQNMAEDQ